MSDDLAFVETLLRWRAEGHQVTVMTVVRTWGSAPRAAGSLMALCDDGRQTGSISGGCIEEDLVARLRAGAISTERPAVIAYGTTRADAARLGLPCGGRFEVVVERPRGYDDWYEIASALQARRCVVRRLRLDDGTTELLGSDEDLLYDYQTLARRFGPRWRLLLVGATDLARHVVHCAAHLDYQIAVCEPRAESRASWEMQGTTVDPRMPDEAALDFDDARAAVTTLTHDPRLDDLALMQALTGRAFYVGALGSEATSAKRRERLLALGLPPDAVARLHAPVGVAIHSRTPAEIAISILAHITSARRRLETRQGTLLECAQ